MTNLFCDGPTCKGKETFTFAKGGPDGQKLMSIGLPLTNFFFIWGICA